MNRFIFLRTLLLTIVCLMAGGGNSAAFAQGGSPTITVDPTAVEGISIETPEDTAPEPPGPIGRALNEVIPKTGNDGVDGATSKLSEAVSGLIEGAIAALPQLIIGTIVLVLTFLLAGLARRIVTRLAEKAKLRPNLVDLFGIMARIAVWFAGVMIAASIVFPGFGPGQLIATAGLASIAIGFAFQDIFENFFAGILILLNFPFHAGDFIEVDGLTGKVEDITIRMTKLRQTSGELLLIPNATIFKGNVNVLTNKPKRRIELAVGIAYGEDVGEGRQVILDAVKACDTVDQSGDFPEVLASGFGASSIDFDVIWWTKSSPIATRRSRDQVIEAVKKALDNAGIEIPYPYRTLTFSPNEPDIIRAFATAGRGDADAQKTEGD